MPYSLHYNPTLAKSAWPPNSGSVAGDQRGSNAFQPQEPQNNSLPAGQPSPKDDSFSSNRSIEGSSNSFDPITSGRQPQSSSSPSVENTGAGLDDGSADLGQAGTSVPPQSNLLDGTQSQPTSALGDYWPLAVILGTLVIAGLIWRWITGERQRIINEREAADRELTSVSASIRSQTVTGGGAVGQKDTVGEIESDFWNKPNNPSTPSMFERSPIRGNRSDEIPLERIDTQETIDGSPLVFAQPPRLESSAPDNVIEPDASLDVSNEPNSNYETPAPFESQSTGVETEDSKQTRAAAPTNALNEAIPEEKAKEEEEEPWVDVSASLADSQSRVEVAPVMYEFARPPELMDPAPSQPEARIPDASPVVASNIQPFDNQPAPQAEPPRDEELRQLKESVQTLEQELESKHMELQEAQKRIENLDRDLAAAKTQLETQTQQTKAENVATEQRLELETKNSELANTLAQTEQTVQEYEDRLREQSAECEKANAHANELEKALTQAAEQLEVVIHERQQLEKTHQQTDQERTELSNSLVKKEGETRRIKNELQSTIESFRDLQTEYQKQLGTIEQISATSEELVNLRQTQHQMTAEINSLTQSNKKLQIELADAKAYENEAKQAAESLEVRLQKRERELVSARAAFDESQTSIAELKNSLAKLSPLESELDSVSKELADRQERLLDLKAKHLSANSELESVRDELKTALKKNSEQGLELAEKENQLIDLESESSNENVELELVRDQLLTLETDGETTHKALYQANLQIQKLTQRIADLEQDLETASEQNAEVNPENLVANQEQDLADEEQKERVQSLEAKLRNESIRSADLESQIEDLVVTIEVLRNAAPKPDSVDGEAVGYDRNNLDSVETRLAQLSEARDEAMQEAENLSRSLQQQEIESVLAPTELELDDDTPSSSDASLKIAENTDQSQGDEDEKQGTLPLNLFSVVDQNQILPIQSANMDRQTPEMDEDTVGDADPAWLEVEQEMERLGQLVREKERDIEKEKNKRIELERSLAKAVEKKAKLERLLRKSAKEAESRQDIIGNPDLSESKSVADKRRNKVKKYKNKIASLKAKLKKKSEALKLHRAESKTLIKDQQKELRRLKGQLDKKNQLKPSKANANQPALKDEGSPEPAPIQPSTHPDKQTTPPQSKTDAPLTPKAAPFENAAQASEPHRIVSADSPSDRLRAANAILTGKPFPKATPSASTPEGATPFDDASEQTRTKNSATPTEAPQPEPAKAKPKSSTKRRSSLKQERRDNLKRIEGIGPKIEALLIDKGIASFEDLNNASIEQLHDILTEAGPRYQRHSPATWPQQAELAATGDWDRLKAFQESQKSNAGPTPAKRTKPLNPKTGNKEKRRKSDVPINRPVKKAENRKTAKQQPTSGEREKDVEASKVSSTSLTRIEGIGPSIEKVLMAAGIRSFAELAATEPEALSEILSAAGPRFNRSSPKSWPRQAQLAAAGKWADLDQLQSKLKAGR